MELIFLFILTTKYSELESLLLPKCVRRMYRNLCRLQSDRIERQELRLLRREPEEVRMVSKAKFSSEGAESEYFMKS